MRGSLELLLTAMAFIWSESTPVVAAEIAQHKVAEVQSTAQPATPHQQEKRHITAELQEFRHSIKEIRRNAQSLMSEFNRSDMRILEFGDFINQYIDDKPQPFQEQLYPYGFQNIGNTGTTQSIPLPPRKEWVKHYRDNVKELSKLANTELADVLAHADKSDLVDKSNDLMQDLIKTSAELDAVTEGSDEKARQHAIVEIIDDATELEVNVKRLVREAMRTAKK